jgi:hypothetical protein
MQHDVMIDLIGNKMHMKVNANATSGKALAVDEMICL